PPPRTTTPPAASTLPRHHGERGKVEAAGGVVVRGGGEGRPFEERRAVTEVPAVIDRGAGRTILAAGDAAEAREVDRVRHAKNRIRRVGRGRRSRDAGRIGEREL